MRITTTITALLSLTAFAGLASAGDPPKELAAMARTMEGTWTCKGQALGHDMKAMVPMTATLTSKVEMAGFWMHDSFDAKMGDQPFHFESYTTFDATAKKWKRVMVEVGGGWSAGEATGTGAKLDFELQSHGPMGDSPFRDHVDASNPKAVKAWGEFSMDKARSWTKVYEMTCSK
jgi:hypothetical protein